MNRIGFNVGSQFINDTEREFIYRYMREANPTTMLFMEGFAEALQGYYEQRQANPDTEPIVIYRSFRDLGNDYWPLHNNTDDWLRVTDNIWNRENQHIWVYLFNEPHVNGYSDVRNFSQKLADGLDKLCKAGYKVVVGNFSAGTVDHPEWMKEFLYKVSEYKDQILLSEHWYSTPIPPHGYSRQYGNGEVGGKYLPIEDTLNKLEPKYWPNGKQIQEAFDGLGEAHGDGNTLWHYGRISRFYIYARDVLNIELPDFVITEGLLDNMPDLSISGGKLRTFDWEGHNATIYDHIERKWGVPAGIWEIKGDISYRKMYEDVYDLPFDQVLALMLEHFNETAPKQCRGVTLFTASNSEDWVRYGHNYLDVPGLWEKLISYSQSYDDTKEESTPDYPTYIEPKYRSLSIQAFTFGKGRLNVRKEPTLTSDVVATVGIGDIISFDTSDYYVMSDSFEWKRVQIQGNEYWLADNLIQDMQLIQDSNIPELLNQIRTLLDRIEDEI